MLAKIALLREEHDVLLKEKKDNDSSGKRVLIRLEQMASDKEVDKYRQFLENNNSEESERHQIHVQFRKGIRKRLIWSC